jgi:hypothetical protein
MIACTIDSSLKQLCFEAFPTKPLNCVNVPPIEEAGFVRFRVGGTARPIFIYVKPIEFQKVGISSTICKRFMQRPEKLNMLVEQATAIDGLLKKAAHVASAHLSQQNVSCLTDNTALVNRVICWGINTHVKRSRHISGITGVPEMYFQPKKSSIGEIFINVDVADFLGSGTFGVVSKAIRVTAPPQQEMLVAKKVFTYWIKESTEPFDTEIGALRGFSQKRGIISLIAGGLFQDQYVLFLPIYECNFCDYFTGQSSFSMTWDEALSATEQWLEGLVTISKKGIHGDISAKNLLLKKKGQKIEAVISDFGAFRSYGKEEHGLTTFPFGSPEYFAKKMVTSKNDVWALGLSVHKLFSEHSLPCHNLSLEEVIKWTSQLTSDWLLQYPTVKGTPSFLVDMIKGMLDPNPDSRWAASEAFGHFSKGYALFKEAENAKLSAKKRKRLA